MIKSFILAGIFILLIQFQALCQFNLQWYKTVPGAQFIINVRFSHDSKWILAICESTKIYDVQTGEIVKDSLPSTQNPFFSHDDSHIIGYNGKNIIYFNLVTYKDDSNFEPSDKDITWSTISQDGKYFLGTTSDGFRVWDIESGKIVKSKIIPVDPKAEYYGFGNQYFSCDNSKIFLSTIQRYKWYDFKGNPIVKYSKILNIYDFNTLDSIKNLYYRDTNSTEPLVSLMALSDDCNLIAITTDVIKIYDYNNMQLISTENYPSGLSRIKFTPDNKYLVTASGSNGNNLILWDVQTGKKLVERPETSYETLDISNDGKYIAISVSAQLAIFNNPILGISNPTENPEEILYPNPTNGSLTVNVNLLNPSILKIELTDMNGILLTNLYNQFTEQGTQTIQLNLENQATGAYILRLNALNYYKVFKLIMK